MKPYRMELWLCLAAEDIEAAEVKFDVAVEALVALGVHVDGGGLELMDSADVIKGSPLDHELS